MTASLETLDTPLQRISCICYPIYFQKQHKKIRALIDSDNEVNAMTPIYVAQLDLIPRTTNINTQIIDSLALKTHGMTTARFLVEDKLKWTRFFEETFLLANTSIKVILGMSFLSFSNADIEFIESNILTW